MAETRVSSSSGDLGSIGVKRLFSATIGSTLSWSRGLFDVFIILPFIILYVAPTVEESFFPSGNRLLSLASVCGAYAATVVMLPSRSGIFGSHADRRGGRGAMTTTVVRAV